MNWKEYCDEWLQSILLGMSVILIVFTFMSGFGYDFSLEGSVFDNNAAPVITNIEATSEPVEVIDLCRELLPDGSLSEEVYDCDTLEVIDFG